MKSQTPKQEVKITGQKTFEQNKTEYELEVVAKMSAETQNLVKDVLVHLDILKNSIDHNTVCTENIMVFLEQNKTTEKATEKQSS